MAFKKIIYGIGALAASAFLYASPVRAQEATSYTSPERKIVTFPGDLGQQINAKENKKYNLEFDENLESLVMWETPAGYHYVYNLSNVPESIHGNLTKEEFDEIYAKIKRKYEANRKKLGKKPKKSWSGIEVTGPIPKKKLEYFDNYFQRDFIGDKWRNVEAKYSCEWFSASDIEEVLQNLDLKWLPEVNLGGLFAFVNQDKVFFPDYNLNVDEKELNVLVVYNFGLNKGEFHFGAGAGFEQIDEKVESVHRHQEDIFPVAYFAGKTEKWKGHIIIGNFSNASGDYEGYNSLSDPDGRYKAFSIALDTQYIFIKKPEIYAGLNFESEHQRFGTFNTLLETESQQIHVYFGIHSNMFSAEIGILPVSYSGEYSESPGLDYESDFIQGKIRFGVKIGRNARLELGARTLLKEPKENKTGLEGGFIKLNLAF